MNICDKKNLDNLYDGILESNKKAFYPAEREITFYAMQRRITEWL